MVNKEYTISDFLTLKVKLNEIGEDITADSVDDMLFKAGIVRLVGDNKEYIQLEPTELANMYAYISLSEEFHAEFGRDTELTDKLFRMGYITKNGMLTDNGFRFIIKPIIYRSCDMKIIREVIKNYRKHLLEMIRDEVSRPSNLIDSFDIENMTETEIYELLRNTYIMNDGNGIVNETYLIKKGIKPE